MRARVALAGVALLAACADAMVPTFDVGLAERTLEVDGVVRAYKVYVPPGYDARREWPLVVFLHGGGERGTDGVAPTQVGVGLQLLNAPERWPGLVLFPQVAEGEIWQGTPARVALAALDSAFAEFSVDRDRIYLTGLSLGGNGTWYLGYNHPERFAALVPIAASASGPPRLPTFVSGPLSEIHARIADRLSDVPIWIFHGDRDPAIPVAEARRMAAALEAVGGDVRYDELRGVGHNAWDPAYGDPRLTAWLFSQRRE